MPSAYVQKLIASQRTAAKFPYLIEITHPEYPPMCYANASEDITYDGKIYYSASFSIQPPESDETKIGDATLTISAIDQIWIEKIRATQKPAQIRFIAVIVYENGIVKGVEPLEDNSFTLRAASFNEVSISWSMSFDENMAIEVPCDICDAITAPGCA